MKLKLTKLAILGVSLFLLQCTTTQGELSQAAPTMSRSATSSHNKADDVLAAAYQAVGHGNDTVIERIKLDKLYTDEASKTANAHALWLTLTKMPTAKLQTLAAEAGDDKELAGWAQLALLSRQHYSGPQPLLAQLEKWQNEYPAHAAQAILPSSLPSIEANLRHPPQHIALLLPISGPLSGPGHAIQDGFMAAAEANSKTDKVVIQVYDTNGKDVAVLYQQAIEEGADYIVGPLSKAQVATVAQLDHPVPTLLLNDVDGSLKNNAYQLGLSPNTEARHVALQARKRGYSRALIIAPEGDWGREVVASFNNQWISQGGQVIDTFHYHPNDDMNASMRRFLQINESESRAKRMKQLLGRHLETSSSRRQDFDMVFLLAYPSKARQIVPLLKYYFAGDVPVYATSTAYSGSPNAMKDRDLNGVIFCDMPWVFHHQMGSRNWPEQFNSYNRLYALGKDSYAVASDLNQLLLFPAVGLENSSGPLYLQAAQQIAHIPAWGQFKQGIPQVM